MKIQTIFIAIFLLLALTACTQPVVVNSNGELLDQRLVTVSGQSEVTSAPDQAEIDISVVSRGRTPGEAQEQNARDMDAVINALKKISLTDKDVQTGSYNLQQEQKWNEDTSSYITLGYTVTNSIHITSKNMGGVGDILDLVVQSGANRIERVQFTLSKEKKSKVFDSALQKAAEDAKTKATALSTTLGARIKQVHSIQEYNYVVRPYEYGEFALKSMAADARAPTPIIPRDVETSAQVTVAFELE